MTPFRHNVSSGADGMMKTISSVGTSDRVGGLGKAAAMPRVETTTQAGLSGEWEKALRR